VKHPKFLLPVLFLIFALAVEQADSRMSGGVGRGGGGMGFSSGRASSFRSPAVINMSRGSSGWHNHNFPSQSHSWSASQGTRASWPSYGQLHWNGQARSRFQSSTWSPSTNRGAYSRPNLSAYSGSGVRAAVVVHHHPYSPGFVRQKLRNIGVTSEPRLISDRSEMVHTDRQHSTIRLPQEGPGHSPLRATAISPRHFNDPLVRQQMNRLGGSDWTRRIDRFNSTETQTNHYYWHQGDGFNYCHYNDSSGYHWWGWYQGGQCFWTRNYAGRWWWYDQDYNRWCFWNDNYWWWQDPYHMGDLYCYDNDGYVPCNSADDQEVVTAPVGPGEQAYNSPDGTRLVKIAGDSQDAFLYDSANPPTFEPVYLASGVDKVQFSNSGGGRTLEILLRLNDGSFDMFDGYGNPYNPGKFDGEQAAR
jgi:hypothetical protein